MLTADRLRKLLHYDPMTGDFRWRVAISNRIPIWSIAGTTCRRQGKPAYRQIRIDGRFYLAHRLALLHVTGRWPEDRIDHENLDGMNNRWSNLRPATQSQNMANRRAPANNTSGFKGVYWHKPSGRWMAAITFRRKSVHLGYFSTPETAHAAYAAKAKELFKEFARAA